MSETSPPPARRGRLRTLLRYGLIALVAVAAVIYLARRQIGNLLARTLDEQLVAAGVFVDWKSAAWVPGPGIRFRDLALYRDAAKRDRLALLGHVTAIKGQPGWSRWDSVNVEVQDDRLVLGSGAAAASLDHLNLKLRIEPGKIALPECRASLFGLRIEAKGSYAAARDSPASKNGETAKPTGSKEGVCANIHLDWLSSLKEWATFKGQKEEPVLKVEFQSQPGGSGVDLTATLAGEKFEWRGQHWDLVDAAIRTSAGAAPAPVEIDRLRIGRSGQTAEIAGQFDVAKSIVRIGKFESGLDVLALARAFVPGAAANMAAITAAGNWRISGEGEIPLDHPEKTRWSSHVSLDGSAGYSKSGTAVMLQKPALDLRMSGQVLELAEFKAGLWDGSLVAPASRIFLAPPDGKPKFETQVAIEGAHLQSVMNSFGTSQRQPGVVRINWKGGGGVELASITGSGSLAIHQAEFFRIPLLGPLHLVFDKLAPGFGKDVASSLTANHRLEGGQLKIENLKLESKLTRIEADGTVDLMRQHAHLTAKAKLQGIVGLATNLLSALLEVEGEGPVSDVHWKLKNLPGTEVIGAAADVVGKAGGAVIQGAGGAVKETGKAAKGLLKIPGKLLGR